MYFDVQRFSEEDIPKQSIKSLKKGIRSLMMVVEKHKAKILNPELFYPEWNALSEKTQLGNIKHWRKEIDTANQSIFDRIEELRKRGVKIDE